MNIFGINTVTFNVNNTNEYKAYICPNNDDCQIICNGHLVCREAIFVCPVNYNCIIKCAPDDLINTNACNSSSIIATYSPSLTVECLNWGCHNMVINMTYGNNLTIFEPYIGYIGEQMHFLSMHRMSMLIM